MQKYISVLNASGADAWEIVRTRTRGWEFYFIGHRLDQNRAKNVEHVMMKVYKLSEDGGSLGIASADVAPTETEEELKKIAEDLVCQASLVKNKPYKLNPPVSFEPMDISLRPLREESADFIRTMNGITETDTEYLNSFEIFTNQVERRLVNSEGVDVTENYPTSMLEVVVNARKDRHEIELYRLYKAGSCDSAKIKHDIEELLQIGKDKLAAVPTPPLEKTAAVFSTDAALMIYNYFLENLDASFLVSGMSRFGIGKPITENIEGDRITLESVRVLPGSPSNFSCDPEGAPIRNAVLIRDSVPEKFIGSRMFSQYLGLRDSFSISNWRVTGGSRSAEEIRSGKFLEIVEFSNFGVDAVTGDIFGEIRLAYYHDGTGRVIPVSGGSISGNMQDNLAKMRMSKETRIYSNAEIPAVTRLESIMVAGAE